MKKRFICCCCDFICKHQACDELKIKKLKYGLEGLYNLLTKMIVLFVLTLLLGIVKEFLFLTCCYALTKSFTYGLHAKTTMYCWLTTIPIYIIGTYFIIHAELPYYVTLIIWSIGFISFLLWAPADTPARPLIHKEKRMKQKLKACLVCLIFLAIIVFYPEQIWTNAICYSLVIQSICINPITYKLTKTPFANYKIYLKKHGLNY